MTVTVQELAEAIGTQISTVDTGIRALPYLGDTFTPPVAVVGIHEIDFHGAFGEPPLSRYTFIVFAILARSSDRAGLEQMEGLMSVSGATSLRSAVESDPTLGGVANSAVVLRAGPPAAISINSAEYISCPFEVEVYA